MIEPEDLDYYMARAHAERVLAQSSLDSTIAKLHAQMADHYDQVVARLRVGEVVQVDSPGSS